MEAPKQHLLTVSERGCELRQLIVDGDNVALKTLKTIPGISEGIWSPDGKKFALITERSSGSEGGTDNNKAIVYDAESLNVITEIISLKPIRKLAFSPKGNFLMYCIARESAETEKNFFCYQNGHPKPIFNVPLKDYSENWPNFFITDRETFAARRAGDGILMYIMPSTGDDEEVPYAATSGEPVPRPAPGSSVDLGAPFAKFPTEKIPASFAISCEIVTGDSSLAFVAVFSGTKKGKGSGKLFVSSSKKPNFHISSAMINCEGGTVQFVSDGSMAIFEAKLKQDKTNCSYYGNSTLHAIGATSSRKIDIVNAIHSPVHSFTCRPGNSQVMVAYGPLPAKIRLIDTKTGKETANFGENRRNHFRFNSCAKWVLIGGFGALNGDTEVYDLSNGEVIGASRFVDNVVAEWFMDGRHAVLATTSPRLRVDNKLMIMRYNCEVLLEEKYKRLTTVLTQPIPSQEAFKYFPPSPATHTPMKNVMDGVKSYIPPAMRRKMEAEGKTAQKGTTPKAGVIKAQGEKAKIAGVIKTPSPIIPKDEGPKMGFKLPF